MDTRSPLPTPPPPTASRTTSPNPSAASSPRPSRTSSPRPHHNHARQPSHPLQNTLTYLTDPLTYTLTSLTRRLSADAAPTPLARALSANYNGTMLTPQPVPPARRPSPFQPPPLTKLRLEDPSHPSDTHTPQHPRKPRHILTAPLAEEIRLLLPARLQLQSSWHLAYALAEHGATLKTLYARCDAAQAGTRGGFVLVVRDIRGGVFGAYLSEAPRVGSGYFGSGECFLWRCVRLGGTKAGAAGGTDGANGSGGSGGSGGGGGVPPGLTPAEEAALANLPPPPSEDTTHAQRMTTLQGLSRGSSAASLIDLSDAADQTANHAPPQSNGHGIHTHPGGPKPQPPRPHADARGASLRFKAFPYTGINDYTLLCQSDFLQLGGGRDGKCGLELDADLRRGMSQGCETFGNEGLSSAGEEGLERGRFEVQGVEVWWVGG